MFAILPTGFPGLAAAVATMHDVDLGPPPSYGSLAESLRASIAANRIAGRKVPTRIVRQLPYAYWLDGEPCITAVEPDLVKSYWSSYLVDAVKAGPRQAKRWMLPLFHTYCDKFAPADHTFVQYGSNLGAVTETRQSFVPSPLIQLQALFAFFDPAEVARRMAGALLIHEGSLEHWLKANSLWEEFPTSALGDHVLDCLLMAPPEVLRNPKVVEKIIDWLSSEPNAISSLVGPHISVANSLLHAWSGHKAPEATRALMIDYFLRRYGDPRSERQLHFQWRGVSSEAIQVLTSWLAGEALRDFMNLLVETADEIWRFRSKFWMAYYDAGHIEDAWLVLGADAYRIAARINGRTHGAHYGRLEGGAAPNQSVLILRIGGLIFTEWSHNGSLRAVEHQDLLAPKLYQSTYHGQDLRDIPSMDFHRGSLMRKELRHAGSQSGTWQRTARDFIRRNTGIVMDDAEILCN